MPVYNGEKYLRDALESILRQTYPYFELIIIDDGSTDHSADIIKSYQDERIVYLKNESNCGIAESLNRGILKAKGEYIARMDCDDIAHPKRLEVQLRIMKRNPEIGVCGSWVRFFGETRGLMTYPIKSSHIKAFLIFRNAFAHPSVMMRKSVLMNNQLAYDRRSILEDYDLWIKLSKKTDFYNTPRVLTYYRVINTSLMHDPMKLSRLKDAFSALVRKTFEAFFNVSLTPRQQILHMADISTLKKEGITLEEGYEWLCYVERLNKINSQFSHGALMGMLSYRWYEICAASGAGLKALCRYFFSRYNGLFYRPWHLIKLVLMCMRRKGRTE
jgi:glycosyltransferase involved in cell wall biosynthesis